MELKIEVDLGKERLEWILIYVKKKHNMMGMLRLLFLAVNYLVVNLRFQSQGIMRSYPLELLTEWLK